MADYVYICSRAGLHRMRDGEENTVLARREAHLQWGPDGKLFKEVPELPALTSTPQERARLHASAKPDATGRARG